MARCAEGTGDIAAGRRNQFERLMAIASERVDLLAVAGFTLFAAVIRLWQLDVLPAGFHIDEASVLLDSERITREGWIGAWSDRASGYPIAVNYVIAPFVHVMGREVLSVRLPIALLGVASVPLFYFVVREVAGRPSALCGTALFAYSLWYLHLNRIGVPVTAWVTMELAALLCMMRGFETRKWWWFLGAGLLMGVGLWIYNSVLLFVLCCVVYAVGWVAWRVWQQRDARSMREALLAGIMLVGVVLAGWPMIAYMTGERASYEGRLDTMYIFSDELRERCEAAPQQLPERCEIATKTSFGERAEVVWERLGDLYRSLVLEGTPDYVDALGERPPLGRVTGYLATVGVAIALLRYWRRPPVVIGVMLIPLLAVATVLTIDGQYRRFLGAMPFLVMFAGIALGSLWEYARQAGHATAIAAVLVIAGCLGWAAQDTLVFYFGGDVRNSGVVRYAFAPDERAALEYVGSLSTPYVYYYNSRHGIAFETRAVLAPYMAGGEDRSVEFRMEQSSAGPRTDLRPARRVALPAMLEPGGAVFVFLDDYADGGAVGEVMARYPGGVLAERYSERYQTYDFRAYYLPGDLLESYSRAEGVSYTPGTESSAVPR